jgi:hypothetical protein
MVMMEIFVDDCLTIGTEEAIEEVIHKLKRHDFVPKVEDNLNYYLSCKIVQERDKGKVWIIQTHFIDNLQKNVGGEISKIQSYTSPGTPQFKIVRPTNELEVIKDDFQSEFRSGMVEILYLIKHSIPEIANEVRKLAKCMDGVILAAYKEMLRVIRFVLDTQLFLFEN